MIIKDKEGVRYRLSKSKLAGIYAPGAPAFYIFLADVRKANVYGYAQDMLSAQLWLGGHGPGHYIRVIVAGNNIGCRKFNRETMQVIKRAIKAAKKAAKQ